LPKSDPLQVVVQQPVAPEFPPKNSNPFLPLLWWDAMIAGIKSDEHVTLRFYAMLSDTAVEVARLQATRPQVIGMMDRLAKLLNHYPEKKDAQAD
jgi:hypothetical protein